MKRVPIVAPAKPTKVVAKLKKVPVIPYNVILNNYDSLDEGGEVEQKGFNFTFQSSTDSFCCGMISIGDFELRTDINVSRAAMIRAIQALIKDFIMMCDGRTVFCTTIDDRHSLLLAEALRDQVLMTPVKKFINPSSKKQNIMWVSNNLV